MPESRITKSSALALVASASTQARITKTAVMFLSTIAQPVYVNQIAVLALISPSDELTTLCQCWKITRKDGVTFAYTTHNESVTFNGTEYKPCNGIEPSACEIGIVNTRDMGDCELNGVLIDDEITEHDIVNGKFEGAIIEGFRVNWSEGNRSNSSAIIKGVIGKSTHKNRRFSFEILTPAIKLKTNPLSESCKPGCRFEFGKGMCPANPESFAQTGSVTNISLPNALTRSEYRQFYDSAMTATDGYFELGILTWLTGDNAGLSSEVKFYKTSTQFITTWDAFPYKIKIGDTYKVVAGCNKSLVDHTAKFGLPVDSFGGFTKIPGDDAVGKTPNVQG